MNPSNSSILINNRKESTSYKILGNKVKLELFENIQFIYELALAKLELEAFGIDFDVTNSLRAVLAEQRFDKKLLKRKLAYFRDVDGNLTDYHFIQRRNQTRSVNQYLTHWIYPYKGKFHPQMIRALLNIIGVKEKETVLDPFIGSGTTALESQLLNVNCIGIDVSPLCVLISKVKTESIKALDEIQRLKDSVSPSTFESHTQGTLFGKKVESISKNTQVRNFFRVTEMIAHSDKTRRKKDFLKSFQENIEKMFRSIQDFSNIKDELELKLGKVNIEEGDARSLNLVDESIDGIITSPPYSIALNYVQNDSHALSALGYNLNKIKEDFIGVRGGGLTKFRLYEEDMEKVYNEMYRVLKKDKYCVIVIGNVTFQGKEVDTTKYVIDYCQKIGFSLIKKIDKIIFGLYNVMQKEYILIFKKI